MRTATCTSREPRIEAGFRRLKLQRTLVIGTKTDILFPIHQQHQLADGIRTVCDDTYLVELDCIQGHDAFLVDMDAFRPVMRLPRVRRPVQLAGAILEPRMR
jgi:homoserine acetyltransferase